MKLKLTAMIAACALLVSSAAAQQQWKDRQEYDMFQEMVKETDPTKKLEKIQAWQTKYPESAFKKEGITLRLNTYAQSQKFPEVIQEALTKTGLSASDIDLFVPHQANLRISQFVQHKLGLRDDQVWNNIQRYGNTTAASIPIALCEAWEQGAVKDGDLVCLAAFGSGFTWGSALIRL